MMEARRGEPHYLPKQGLLSYEQRDNREGWPLLTVETEANWNSHMKGVLPWLVSLGSSYRALLGQVQNVFSSLYTIQFYFSISLSNFGRQSFYVACLLTCVFGY